MPTAGVDFFRVDRSRTTRRLLVVAGVLVAAGATSVGAHLMHRLPAQTGHVISLVGGLTMLSGLVLGFGTMAMMLFENVYLVIGEEALVLHENGEEITIQWGDLARVASGEPGYLVFGRKGGEDVRWFVGSIADDVKGKIDDARRKAIHGLLKTGTSDPPGRS